MSHSIELEAAIEEIATLDKLAEGFVPYIREGRTVRSRQVIADGVEIEALRVSESLLKGFEELAHHVYGRTAIGRVTDENGELKGSFVYRISQANVSYLDKGCNILGRNSTRVTELISARPGDEVEVVKQGKPEYLEVDEVRVFDGPTGLLRPSGQPDFRMMSLHQRGQNRSTVLQYLRASVTALPQPEETAKPASELAREVHSLAAPSSVPAVEKDEDKDPTWLTSWDGIYLSSSETQSLGHEFFTRTTIAQETALNVPRGLTFVEGIAGAGKTSVALGRLGGLFVDILHAKRHARARRPYSEI